MVGPLSTLVRCKIPCMPKSNLRLCGSRSFELLVRTKSMIGGRLLHRTDHLYLYELLVTTPSSKELMQSPILLKIITPIAATTVC